MRLLGLGLLLLVGCGSDRPGVMSETGEPDLGAALAVCGDDVCSTGETCMSCHDDCGDCPACAAAPSCTDAVGVPSAPLHRYDLDVGTMTKADAGAWPMVPAT